MSGRSATPTVEVMNNNTTSRLGLRLTTIVGLALLGAPRVVLHDLGIVTEGMVGNLLLVVVPLLVWIGVVLAAHVPNPFVTLTVIGLCYGVLLAVIHQILWAHAFPGAPPQLGGNLSQLAPAAQTLLLRGAAVISSLFTGTIIGAVCGVVGWALAALTGRRADVGARR
jgi:hypothetical protein